MRGLHANSPIVLRLFGDLRRLLNAQLRTHRRMTAARTIQDLMRNGDEVPCCCRIAPAIRVDRQSYEPV